MRHRRPPAVARDRARPSEERSLSDARYIGSFSRADVSLTPALPEIALIGRSNVGKSSLLNALAGRRIAHTSGTPGKTRMMNVYAMDLGSREAGGRSSRLPPPGSLYLLDLPGYGWARASRSDRSGFRPLIAQTLDRPGLAGIVWLLDVRRDPSAEDRTMQDLLAARGTRVLAAITKSDKLPRGQRLRREEAIRTALALDADQTMLTSVRSREGIADLGKAIGTLARDA